MTNGSAAIGATWQQTLGYAAQRHHAGGQKEGGREGAKDKHFQSSALMVKVELGAGHKDRCEHQGGAHAALQVAGQQLRIGVLQQRVMLLLQLVAVHCCLCRWYGRGTSLCVRVVCCCCTCCCCCCGCCCCGISHVAAGVVSTRCCIAAAAAVDIVAATGVVVGAAAVVIMIGAVRIVAVELATRLVIGKTKKITPQIIQNHHK